MIAVWQWHPVKKWICGAIDEFIQQNINSEQKPSMGCSIKWNIKNASSFVQRRFEFYLFTSTTSLAVMLDWIIGNTIYPIASKASISSSLFTVHGTSHFDVSLFYLSRIK
jgi:hypothetical protein